MKIILDLTKEEVDLLRNCTSDLGFNHIFAISLQLKVANAIIDSTEEI